MFRTTITNDEINQMPVEQFRGRILVVDDEKSMHKAGQILQGETLLGFDTETRPAFTKGVQHDTALVQISTADTALLFRLKHIRFSDDVRRVLESPRVLKIGAAIRDDIKGMQKMSHLRPGGFVDLQSIVGRWGINELSVKKMAAIVLGIKVSKAQRLTNWEAASLTPAQQSYAATDAWVCREIYLRLQQAPPLK